MDVLLQQTKEGNMIEMPTYMLIRHKARDFFEWKRVYDTQLDEAHRSRPGGEIRVSRSGRHGTEKSPSFCFFNHGFRLRRNTQINTGNRDHVTFLSLICVHPCVREADRRLQFSFLFFSVLSIGRNPQVNTGKIEIMLL